MQLCTKTRVPTHNLNLKGLDEWRYACRYAALHAIHTQLPSPFLWHNAKKPGATETTRRPENKSFWASVNVERSQRWPKQSLLLLTEHSNRELWIRMREGSTALNHRDNEDSNTKAPKPLYPTLTQNSNRELWISKITLQIPALRKKTQTESYWYPKAL